MGAKLKGDEQWLEALEGIGDAAADIRPASDEMHEEVLRQARAASIKRVTGRLQDSQILASHPDHVFVADPRRVTVATKDPAAIFNPQYVADIDPAPLMDILADHVIEGADDD